MKHDLLENYIFCHVCFLQCKIQNIFLFKVNHFPGSGFITNKASLVTIDIPAIPLAFQIPNDKNAFLKEVYYLIFSDTNANDILGSESPTMLKF